MDGCESGGPGAPPGGGDLRVVFPEYVSGGAGDLAGGATEIQLGMAGMLLLVSSLLPGRSGGSAGSGFGQQVHRIPDGAADRTGGVPDLSLLPPLSGAPGRREKARAGGFVAPPAHD